MDFVITIERKMSVQSHGMGACVWVCVCVSMFTSQNCSGVCVAVCMRILFKEIIIKTKYPKIKTRNMHT